MFGLHTVCALLAGGAVHKYGLSDEDPAGALRLFCDAPAAGNVCEARREETSP